MPQRRYALGLCFAAFTAGQRLFAAVSAGGLPGDLLRPLVLVSLLRLAADGALPLHKVVVRDIPIPQPCTAVRPQVAPDVGRIRAADVLAVSQRKRDGHHVAVP